MGPQGLGSLVLGKVLPVLAAIVVAAAAWANGQPAFVLILAALGAAVLTLGASLLGLLIFERIATRSSTNAPKATKKGSRVDRPRNSSLGISMVIAAFILVGGAWVIFNWPSQLQYDQTKLIFGVIARPPIPDIHQFLGFNVLWNNSGPLEIANYRSNYKFKQIGNSELTDKEIDDEFDDVTSRVPQKDLVSNSVPPGGPGSYLTMEDQRFTPEDWREVIGGKSTIYFFAVFKYDVGDKTKIADICLLYNKDFPAVHNCLEITKHTTKNDGRNAIVSTH